MHVMLLQAISPLVSNFLPKADAKCQTEGYKLPQSLVAFNEGFSTFIHWLTLQIKELLFRNISVKNRTMYYFNYTEVTEGSENSIHILFHNAIFCCLIQIKS
jgi:hypothetical protein